MKYKIDIEERTFHFIQPAGTSRGVYHERKSWLLYLSTNEQQQRIGIGECAPLPDLSCDASPNYLDTLRTVCNMVEAQGEIPYDILKPYPSMLFGLETALLHFEKGSFSLFDTPFAQGQEGIPINGLVWMGSYDEMLQRLQDKINKGFRCVKLKIGAIDFEQEIELIRIIRESFSSSIIQLRVDANGGFTPADVMRKLDMLAKFDIHSIEQPIRQKNWTEMRRVCDESPIPVALDEELIGVNITGMKAALLDTICPQYIVLKPSLHGGMRGTREWAAMAAERGIGSWITSALESNIGLNAVAQLAADIYGPGISFPQGLGTGQLFSDNIDAPIGIKDNMIWALRNS